MIGHVISARIGIQLRRRWCAQQQQLLSCGQINTDADGSPTAIPTEWKFNMRKAWGVQR